MIVCGAGERLVFDGAGMVSAVGISGAGRGRVLAGFCPVATGPEWIEPGEGRTRNGQSATCDCERTAGESKKYFISSLKAGRKQVASRSAKRAKTGRKKTKKSGAILLQFYCTHS